MDKAITYRSFLRDAEFAPFYVNIAADFGFDPDKDRAAAALIRKIYIGRSSVVSSFARLENTLNYIGSILSSVNILYVFGGGVDSRNFLQFVLDNSGLSGKTYFPHVWAIDGAAELLFDRNIIPSVVITDLDGLTFETSVHLVEYGCIFIIHAHGDNVDKIEEFKPIIEKYENVICTTQVESNPPVLNCGGFTDGDRFLFFIENYPFPERVYLIGYDFGGGPVGCHSKPEYSSDIAPSVIKRKKLEWGAELSDLVIGRNKKRFVVVEIGVPVMLRSIDPFKPSVSELTQIWKNSME